MKKHLFSITFAAMALLAGGCLPEAYLWWSPDGRQAAVRTADGLRLADTNGQLSAVVLPGEIQSAAWRPDGAGLVVSRSLRLTNWAAVEKLIPPEEAAATLQMARAMPDLLKAGLAASGGSWDDLHDKFLKPLGLTESPALAPAWFFCAVSLYREPLAAVIAGYTNAAALGAELFSTATNGVSVFEISILALRRGQPAGEPRALLRSLRPLLDPVLSPQHALLAFRTGAGALQAMALDGGSPRVIAGEDVCAAVWSADGRALIHAVREKSHQMGEIRSRTVASAGGELLTNAPPAETWALAAFADSVTPRLSVLPDGRLLFASRPITLPARAAAITPRAQFYLLDPAKPNAAPGAVAVASGSLPDDLSAFAPSPDGRFVAVVEGGTDAVALFELATGSVKSISPAHAGCKARLIPAWRNYRELTFAALPSASAARPELILWQAEAPERVLSRDWPDKVVDPWLVAPRQGDDPPAR